MTPERWSCGVLAALGVSCAPAPTAPTAPEAPAPAVSVPGTPATTPAPPPAGSWTPVEDPKKAAKTSKPPRDLASCVASLRAAQHLGDAQGSDLYDSALEGERASNLDGSRRLYLQLIQNFPASPLLPFAYLAFGELFAEDAKNDPSKWELARQAYRKVLEYPPQENEAYTYTQFRLGEVESALGEQAKALDAFRKTILAARSGRPLCAEHLIPAAQNLAVQAYAKAGSPAKAEPFFAPLSADTTELGKLLQLLADEYQRSGDSRAVCQVAASPRAPAQLKSRCLPP